MVAVLNWHLDLLSKANSWLWSSTVFLFEIPISHIFQTSFLVSPRYTWRQIMLEALTIMYEFCFLLGTVSCYCTIRMPTSHSFFTVFRIRRQNARTSISFARHLLHRGSLVHSCHHVLIARYDSCPFLHQSEQWQLCEHQRHGDIVENVAEVHVWTHLFFASLSNAMQCSFVALNLIPSAYCVSGSIPDLRGPLLKKA